MCVLVTGGAGYIGSHTCFELLREGYEVVAVDSLINSKEESLRRVQNLTGKEIAFHQLDLRDHKNLEAVFKQYHFDAVIHLAGIKSVGESVVNPLLYYDNNLSGSIILYKVMQEHRIKNLIFSSSATVYGSPQIMPITEEFPVGEVKNPYGRTKWMIEEILYDLHFADPSWNIIRLRYFNPVGAHESGEIGEDPNGIPGNLIPYIAQVAVGKLPIVKVFGDDYPTPDGTGVRDYVHVVDVANGHLRALEKLKDNPGLETYNLGTGMGSSVLEIIAAFEKNSGVSVPYIIAPRRNGDSAVSYTNPDKAKEELGWQATRNLDQICTDVWRWQSKNPSGYE